MSLIKQVLQLKQMGESNRGIARVLPINKGTVNEYMRLIASNKWKVEDLLAMEDPVLEHMFHAGNPAYTDPRMEEFLRLLPEYKELLLNPKNHVNRQVLYEEYRAGHPDGYGQSQFYYHLKQNLVAQKDVTAVLSNTYRPGQKLMADFAGDKLHYTDPETGEVIKVEVFVACLPYSGYTYAVCVPSQKTEDFLHAIRLCLEHLGGTPPILCTDNLKAAVTRADRHEPTINKALEDMGNHYGFVAVPCDPASPTQKALVEDAVRNTYSRVHAKLRNRTFFSIIELNRAVRELMHNYNQTRMQKRPYSREERFHAMEKDKLKPLPAEPYEMLCYADLQVQQNCHIELRHNRTTHFYSVPYIYVGKRARVVFTHSWVKVYVDGKLVASHLRKDEYGYTTVPEHMASNNRAVMERSAARYCEWALHISPDCGRYMQAVFSPQRTRLSEEVFYKLCTAIMSLSRRYELEIFNLTCRQCLEAGIFSYKRFEAVLKHNSQMAAEEGRGDLRAPTPTGHANMRGADYFSPTKTIQQH